MADKNQDGYISKAEFQKLAKNLKKEQVCCYQTMLFFYSMETHSDVFQFDKHDGHLYQRNHVD